jgi:hypothetical protein
MASDTPGEGVAPANHASSHSIRKIPLDQRVERRDCRVCGMVCGHWRWRAPICAAAGSTQLYTFAAIAPDADSGWLPGLVRSNCGLHELGVDPQACGGACDIAKRNCPGPAKMAEEGVVRARRPSGQRLPPCRWTPGFPRPRCDEQLLAPVSSNACLVIWESHPFNRRCACSMGTKPQAPGATAFPAGLHALALEAHGHGVGA